MGQAQLLLIVLGTVVVGLAVMAGINAYEQNNIKSDLDAVTLECMRLASDIQTAGQKPEAFGGLWDTTDTAGEVAAGYDFGDNSAATALNTANLDIIGWSTNGASSVVTVETAGTTTITVKCTSIKFNESATNQNSAQIAISGVNANDLATTTMQFDPDA